MRNGKILLQVVSLLLLMALTSSGCNVGLIDLSATQTAVAGTALAQKTTETALEQAQAVLAATQTAISFTATPTATTQADPTATPTPIPTDTLTPTDTPTNTATAVPTPTHETVALISYHGKYVTAIGEDGDWLLRQELELSDCGQFTLQHLDGGEVALVTRHDLYVTASITGPTGLDWALRQEPELGDCGRFILHDLGHHRVAFETCAGRYIAAVDNSWEQELQLVWHRMGLLSIGATLQKFYLFMPALACGQRQERSLKLWLEVAIR